MTTRGCASANGTSPRHPCAPTKTPRRRAGRGALYHCATPRLDAARRASTSPSATLLAGPARSANVTLMHPRERTDPSTPPEGAASRTSPAACGAHSPDRAPGARGSAGGPAAGADRCHQPVAVNRYARWASYANAAMGAPARQPCGLQLRAGREKLAATYRRTTATRPQPARPARAADNGDRRHGAIGCASAAETAA